MRELAIIFINAFLLTCESIADLPESFEYACKDKNDFIHVKWNKEDSSLIENMMFIQVHHNNNKILDFSEFTYKLEISSCISWIDILSYSTFVFKSKSAECDIYPLIFGFGTSNQGEKMLHLVLTIVEACDSDNYYQNEYFNNLMAIPTYITRNINISIPLDLRGRHFETKANFERKKVLGVTFSHEKILLQALKNNSKVDFEVTLKGYIPIILIMSSVWQRFVYEHKRRIKLPVNSDDFLEINFDQISSINGSNLIARIEAKEGINISSVIFNYNSTNFAYENTLPSSTNIFLFRLNTAGFCRTIAMAYISYINGNESKVLSLEFDNKCKYSPEEFIKKSVKVEWLKNNSGVTLRITNKHRNMINLRLRYENNANSATFQNITDNQCSAIHHGQYKNLEDQNAVLCTIIDQSNYSKYYVFGFMNDHIEFLISSWNTGSN